jgi:hypothetical protein
MLHRVVGTGFTKAKDFQLAILVFAAGNGCNFCCAYVKANDDGVVVTHMIVF